MTAASAALRGGDPLQDVAKLRVMRNAVIGSRTRKSEIVAQGKVPSLVALLENPAASEEVQSLAATIIGSLAHDAPSPTLLSLCRANATSAIFKSLASLADRMASTPPERFSLEAADPTSSVTQQLKLLECYLRTLRALLIALADEVAPGTKWERGLGLGAKARSGSPLPRAGSVGQSAREVVGWHMADAGFEADGDTSMGATIAPRRASVSRQKIDGKVVSPQQELITLARKAIASAFRIENMRLWLGAIFVIKLPLASGATQRHTGGERMASTSTSRAGTRPASPAAAHTPQFSQGTSLSRTSSRMSLSSEAAGSGRDGLTPPASTSTSQAKVLAIVEMVAGSLSSCLSLVDRNEDVIDLSLTPEEVISWRRQAILNFTAADSPYWSSSEGVDSSPARGRTIEPSTVEMQGSFVKRGQSIDGRNLNGHQDINDAPQGISSPQTRATALQPPAVIENATPELPMASSKGVLEVLLEASECGYTKTQEAALWALTELSRENTDTSLKLFACHTPSGLIPTSMLLNLRKDPSPSVRLAAFCCMAHIIKVHPFTPRTNECVLSVLIELMDIDGEIQVAAIFALARLVADDGALQMLACEQYDCIEKLGVLLAKSKLPAQENAMLRKIKAIEGPVRVEEGHLERLREATLTALAALCFQRDEIRRKFVDHTTPSLLPLVVNSLSAPSSRVRIAACRLVRALSRCTSILRTSLIDAGVAARLLGILNDADEEPQVRTEAIASICNLVLKFSPMKQVLLDGGGVPRLVDLIKKSSDGPTRLNALWALKNILYSSETSLKMQVMEVLGWNYMRELAMAADIDVQEQTLNIIRNLCSTREVDVEATLRGFGGGDELLDLIEEVIWQQRSDIAVEQAAFVLVNIATGSEDHRRLIMGRTNLLDALVFFLNHPRPEVRTAGIWTAMNLTQPTRTPHIAFEAASRLKMFGFDKRLKELLDDPEREVSDRARTLLTRFEIS